MNKPCILQKPKWEKFSSSEHPDITLEDIPTPLRVNSPIVLLSIFNGQANANLEDIFLAICAVLELLRVHAGCLHSPLLQPKVEVVERAVEAKLTDQGVKGSSASR